MSFLVALVIPDCRASGKSGIHNHDPSRTDNGGAYGFRARHPSRLLPTWHFKVPISGTPEIGGARPGMTG
jgi:hypothetical protein